MELDLDQYPTIDGSPRRDFYPYTIRDIYHGRYFERPFLAEILKGFLNDSTLLLNPPRASYEVSETLIRIWPNEDRIIKEFMSLLEMDNKINKNNTLIKKELLKRYLKEFRGVSSTYCFINVIEIILKNNQDVFFDPVKLRELDNSPHVSYQCLEIRHVSDNIFEYVPYYITWERRLDEKVHSLNLNRYNNDAGDIGCDNFDNKEFLEMAHHAAYETSPDEDFNSNDYNDMGFNWNERDENRAGMRKINLF